MKISIVTAVRNGSGTIRHCIESIRGQTYPAEHIIIDGASTDGTIDIIAQYGSCIGKAVSEPDHGIYDAMNKGISMATGDIVGTLNADDFYPHEQVIAKVAKVFEQHSFDSCYGDLAYVDHVDSSRVTRYWRSGLYNERSFLWGWMPPHPTFFVRREIYQKYGFFNLNLGSAADYELMLRFLMKYKITTVYVPEVLVKMRVGGISNASFRNRFHANHMDRMAWKVNGLTPHPWTLWMKPIRKIVQFLTPLNHAKR